MIIFDTDSRALTVYKLIVTHFRCFGKNNTFFHDFQIISPLKSVNVLS